MSSPISVCWRLRISVANRSSEPPMTAIAVEQGGVPVALDDLGADRVGVEAERGEHLGLDVRSRWLYVPTGPEILPVPISSTAAASRVRPRSTSNAQPASFSPSVVGSAWTQWVRPIIMVSASARARGDERREQPVAVAQEPLAGRAQLERQAGVDDVAAGQAEMEVAALGADRLGDLADERDDVVVGRPLDLGDPVDVDAGARLERRERVRRG